MTAKVILNPYANRWNAEKRWPEAESALKAAGVDFELAVSELPVALLNWRPRPPVLVFPPSLPLAATGQPAMSSTGWLRRPRTRKPRWGRLD